MSQGKKSKFNFNISLSVLDHLGRNLYRSFVTVLGEAISNAWDAEADNVWINIKKEHDSFIIKDDGNGMSGDDFQNKFLKIGYSKRKNGQFKSTLKNRPFIGRKGIGKLALLSCAEKISILSKTASSNYVGGVIDNSKLDEAILDDLTPQECPLANVDENVFEKYKVNHEKGTIICFENIHDGIKNNLDHLKKIIALYFRFSLIDSSFNIFLNGDKVTVNDLKALADKTQFLWNINQLNDPYKKSLNYLKEQTTYPISKIEINGFIASTEFPSNLNIRGIGEKAGIDIFVNGRLRERNILRHLPAFASRHVASYLYGQIHFDNLDDGNKNDKFTSSREGIKDEDAEYAHFLKKFEEDILRKISEEWDDWRLKHKQDGDAENTTKLTRKQRKAKELVDTTFDEYIPPKGSINKDKIDGWVNDLSEDAQFNVSAYVDCFISENLLRKYIEDTNHPLSPEAEGRIKELKDKEAKYKDIGNISIDIVEGNSDLSYLGMDDLANLFDKKQLHFASLSRDAKEYKPIRNATAHTARLTQPAKNKLMSVYENIKGRLKQLLSNG